MMEAPPITSAPHSVPAPLALQEISILPPQQSNSMWTSSHTTTAAATAPAYPRPQQRKQRYPKTTPAGQWVIDLDEDGSRSRMSVQDRHYPRMTPSLTNPVKRCEHVPPQPYKKKKKRDDTYGPSLPAVEAFFRRFVTATTSIELQADGTRVGIYARYDPASNKDGDPMHPTKSLELYEEMDLTVFRQFRLRQPTMGETRTDVICQEVFRPRLPNGLYERLPTPQPLWKAWEKKRFE